MRSNIFYAYIFLLILAVSLTTIDRSSGQDTTWGIKQGDTFIYWIEEINFSETGLGSNLAFLLGDANRTTIVVVEEIMGNKMVYTIGYFNGTNIQSNQTIEMNSFDIIGDNPIILPTGDLPIVIPLSIENHANYPEYLEVTGNALGMIIEGVFTSDTNSGFPGDISIESEIDQLLIIDASIKISNGSNIDTEIFGTFGDLNSLLLGGLNNITLENMDIGIELAYNLTDGALEHLVISFVGSISTEEESNTSPINGSARVIRNEKYSLEEIAKKHADRISLTGWSIGIISIVIISKIFRKKQLL